MADRSAAAQRVLDAAMGLFADHGYEATTIADIEAAAGLSVGAGGIYRHFASKRELLEAGVRDVIEQDLRMQSVPPITGVTLQESLVLYVRVGLVMIRSQRALLRLLYRDLDGVPDLLAEVKERLIHVGTREFAARIEVLAKEHDLDGSLDFEAVAAIFVGAVVHLGVLEAVLDVSQPVDDERFVAAWVDALSASLTSSRAHR